MRLVPVDEMTSRAFEMQGRAACRVLMTVDAVGGVWRYAMELAAALQPLGVAVVFAGLGPRPSPAQEAEARALGDLVWLEEPLDWMCGDESELETLPDTLARLVRERGIDLLHLNLPSQACGLDVDVPVLTVSHSCVVTWWQAMRDGPLPEAWHWQKARNAAGFFRADAIAAPSKSHADLLERCYGPLPGINVVHNAARPVGSDGPKQDFVFAAARWWDDGKNARVLDLAARHTAWPIRMAGAVAGPAGQWCRLRHAAYCGELPSQEVFAAMRRASIVVSPSLYEPFGLVALEAASAGCALVLSDIPTYRELWSDAALFFDPRDERALADAVDRLAGDPELLAEMASQAFLRSRRFSRAAQASAMNRLYGTLTGIGHAAVAAVAAEG